MQTNDHQIRDYSAELDRKYGAVGTKERELFEEEAWNFYSGQILQNARKEAKVTQAELAERTQTTKSYISKIENMEKMPGIETIAKYLYALNFTLDESKLFIEDLEKSLVKAESELRVLPTFVTRFSQKKSAPVYGNGYSTSSSLKLKNL